MWNDKGLCWIGIHQWGKWEQYDWSGTATHVSFGVLTSVVAITMRRQKRKCALCGKEQDVLVKKG